MKRLIFMLCALPVFGMAQNFLNAPDSCKPTTITTGESRADIENSIINGYTLPDCWTIRKGQVIKLGHGTMPDKRFAFIYQSPIGYFSTTSMNSQSKTYLLSTAKQATVKDIFVYGNKKSGFTVIAKVGAGGMANYWIEIDNAYESGEIVPPEEYASPLQNQNNSSAQPQQQQQSVQDQLKKWKELLDSGAITQEEYDAQKKKLLNQ